MKRIFTRVLMSVALGAALLMPTQSAMGSAPAATTQSNLVDINTATAGQLSTLPGIGGPYAQRIIGGRPYTAKNQLVTKGILPQGVYNKIASRIVARQPSRKK